MCPLRRHPFPQPSGSSEIKPHWPSKLNALGSSSWCKTLRLGSHSGARRTALWREPLQLSTHSCVTFPTLWVYCEFAPPNSLWFLLYTFSHKKQFVLDSFFIIICSVNVILVWLSEMMSSGSSYSAILAWNMRSWNSFEGLATTSLHCCEWFKGNSGDNSGIKEKSQRQRHNFFKDSISNP